MPSKFRQCVHKLHYNMIIILLIFSQETNMYDVEKEPRGACEYFLLVSVDPYDC